MSAIAAGERLVADSAAQFSKTSNTSARFAPVSVTMGCPAAIAIPTALPKTYCPVGSGITVGVLGGGGGGFTGATGATPRMRAAGAPVAKLVYTRTRPSRSATYNRPVPSKASPAGPFRPVFTVWALFPPSATLTVKLPCPKTRSAAAPFGGWLAESREAL